MGAPDNSTATRLNKDFRYSRAKSFTDLLDVHTYHPQGRYFHTVDGRFAKVWLLGSFSADTISEAQRLGVSSSLALVINQFPEGSQGQLIRYCHGDISPALDRYLEDSEAHGFGEDIVNAAVRRQIEGATTGFFNVIDKDDIKAAKQEIASENELTQEDRDQRIQNVERSLMTGQFALQIENLFVFMYTPYWMKTGYMIESKARKLMATFGLHNIKRDYEVLYNKERAKFLEYAARIEQTASNVGFAPASINADQMIGTLYRELNPTRSRSIPPPEYVPGYTVREHLDLGRDAEVPDVAGHVTFSTLRTSPSGWEVDGVHYKVVSARVLPKRIRPGKLYDVMSQIEGEYWVVMNFSVPSQATVRNMLRIRRTAGSGNPLANHPMFKGDEILAEEKKRDIALVVTATNPENQDMQVAIDATIHVVVKNRDERAALTTAQKVADDMWAGGFVERNRADAVIHQCLPMNFRPAGQKMLQRELRMLAVSFADLAPTMISYAGYGAHTSGMLVNNSVGNPVFIDIFATRAAHTLIQGGTGSGKSFLFNALLMQQQKYNPKVFMVDKGRSYQSLCEATGGSYVELVVDESDDGIKPTCLNPFYVTPGKRPSQEDKEFMRDVLVAMVLCGGRNESISKPDANRLLVAIGEVFNRNTDGREVVLSDIYNYLSTEPAMNENGEGRALAQRFVEFTAGQIYGALFDGKLGINWDADIIVFETERMATSKAMPVVMLSLFQQINVFCKWRLDPSRRKIIAVDEAWAVLAQPEAAASIAGFFREMRKYKAAVVLLSQTLSDFSRLVAAATNGSNDGSGGGILENTMHFFLLASAPGDHQTGRELLSLSNEEVKSWASVAGLPPYFSECFYRLRGDDDRYLSGKIRIYSNPTMLWTASSTPEDRKLRNDAVREYSKSMDGATARRRAIAELASKYPLGYRHFLRHQQKK